jgi:N-hydroxyarylamine O-acetyltransferase
MAPAELDAYLERIGYRGSRSPTLATLHALTAAHAQSIPFENLDVLQGRPIALDPAALLDKLVHQRRGGYCFEQNGLLLEVLATLGFAVTPLGARVRWQRPRQYIPPRTHLFVRVDLDGISWLTDVGVGGLSLTAAIRLDSAETQSTPHEPRRILREGGRLFHQVLLGGTWQDLTEFTLEEMPPIDRELANWYTSAHPQSHFRNRLIAARAAPGGVRRTLLGDELTIRGPDGVGQTRKLGSPEELLEVLAAEFDLRFPAGTRFGSSWPP